MATARARAGRGAAAHAAGRDHLAEQLDTVSDKDPTIWWPRAGRLAGPWKHRRGNLVFGPGYIGLSARTVASIAPRPSASMVSAVVPWNRAKAWVARPTGVSAPQPNPSSAPQAHA